MTDREKTEEIKKANENAFKIQNANELAAKNLFSSYYTRAYWKYCRRCI